MAGTHGVTSTKDSRGTEPLERRSETSRELLLTNSETPSCTHRRVRGECLGRTPPDVEPSENTCLRKGFDQTGRGRCSLVAPGRKISVCGWGNPKGRKSRLRMDTPLTPCVSKSLGGFRCVAQKSFRPQVDLRTEVSVATESRWRRVDETPVVPTIHEES